MSDRAPPAARAAVAGGIVLFLILKAYALNPSVSDENIYFYMALRASEGAVPYRDFFFAHPPLHLVPAIMLAKLAGFHLTAFKALPALATAASGWLVWRIGRLTLGALEAATAALLFLFSYDVLRASSHFTGANFAVLLLLGGYFCALTKRHVAAGVCMACATMTALYTVPACLTLLALQCRRDRIAGQRMALSAAACLTAIVTACAIVAGSGFFEQVFSYHLHKPEKPGSFLRTATAICVPNSLLVWGAPLAGVIMALRARRKLAHPPPHHASAGTLTAASAVGLATLLLLASGARSFPYYFTVTFPFLALLGGFSYGTVLRTSRHAWLGGSTDAKLKRPKSRRRSTARRPSTRATRCVALGLVVACFGAEATRRLALERVSWHAQIGEQRLYRWRDAAGLPDWINDAVRAVLWADTREAGAWSPSVTRYLWHETRRLTAADRLRREAVRLSLPNETLFGDSNVAPLVALLANRHIALDEADTNTMRFRSGTTSLPELLARLEQQPPEVVILNPRRGIATMPELRVWVKRHYARFAKVTDPTSGAYMIYERRGRSRP